MASGITNKCGVCTKTVYAAEAVKFEDIVFHKICFKCSTCKIYLTQNTIRYSTSEGNKYILYCCAHMATSVAAGVEKNIFIS